MADAQRFLGDGGEFPVGIFFQTAYLPRPHHHIEYELFCLTQGRVIFTIDNTQVMLRAGDAVFLEPGLVHSVTPAEANTPYRYCAIVFDISVLGSPGDRCRATFENIRIKRRPQLTQHLIDIMTECALAEKQNRFGHELMLKSVLLQTISFIIQTKQFDTVSLLKKTSGYQSFAVNEAVSYIREHFCENITPQTLLSLTNYSKSHFSRLFREETGITVTEYLTRFRLEKACLDLIYSEKNITQIATSNGFSNIQYFSKLFKEYMGCTPKEFQKNGKDVIVPSSIASVG